jgi:hypothetical protein
MLVRSLRYPKIIQNRLERLIPPRSIMNDFRARIG